MQSLSLPALTALHLLGYGAVWLALGAPAGWDAAAFALLLIWISVVDADRFEIPDTAAALLGFSGLALASALPWALVMDHLLGGVLWPLMFWAVAYGYLRARGFDGLGFGDVKMMAGIGLWCGFGATATVVLAASLGGIMILGLRAAVSGKSAQPLSQAKVAFGPFLCLSAWMIWLAGATP